MGSGHTRGINRVWRLEKAVLERASPGASCPDFWQIFGEFAFGEHLIKRGKCESPHEYWDLWWAWVDLNHRPRPYQYCGPLSRSVILRDTGCDPARQSKADALARVAATRGRGASKAQQALVCLGTQAERPRFQDGILEGMLGHSRNPSPTSSTRDLPCSNARRAPNRWHPKVSRRRPYPLRNPPHEGSMRILLEDSRRL